MKANGSINWNPLESTQGFVEVNSTPKQTPSVDGIIFGLIVIVLIAVVWYITK